MRKPLTNRTARGLGLAAAGVAALALAAPAVASAADTGSTSGEPAEVVAQARTTAVCGGAVFFDDAELQRMIDEGTVVRAVPLDQAGAVQAIDIAPGDLPAATITIERLDVPGVPALPTLPALPADAAPGVVIGQAQPC
jgi:hypothetical protein